MSSTFLITDTTEVHGIELVEKWTVIFRDSGEYKQTDMRLETKYGEQVASNPNVSKGDLPEYVREETEERLREAAAQIEP